MRRARGVVGRCGAQISFVACDRRAKSFDRQLPRHITSHAGAFVRVNSRPSRAVSAYMPGQQHVQSSICLYAWVAARQHGSTAALGHSLGFIAVSAGVRLV